MIVKEQKAKRKLPQALESYMPLVHSIASMVSGKLPPNVDYNDLVSDGTIGLLKASDNFDPKRGVKFETYASYRIRGEILDGLKNYSPVPYRVQVMVRDLAKKGYKAVSTTRRIKKAEALLEKKELTSKEFQEALKRIKKIVSASALMYLLSLEEMADKGSEASVYKEITPPEELEFADLKERLKQGVDQLPPLQKKVVDLFFNKGLNQRSIADRLSLSRPKVCRLLGKAVNILRDTVK